MARQEKPGAGDYIWLAYSIFFFIEPLVRNNALYWTKSALIYLVFLTVYVSCIRTPHRTRKLLLLLAMSLLGLAAFPFNAGASCFLTFAVALLPFTIDSTVPVVVSVTLAAIAVVLEGRLLHLEWPNYSLAVFMMIVVSTSNVFIAQKKRATGRLLIAQEEIERLAALAERERIARDMHDVLGHTLSVIVLKSELARRLLEQHASDEQPASSDLSRPSSYLVQTAALEVAEIEVTARKALAEVRQAISGYRSEGLAAELDLARRTLHTAGVRLDIDASPHPSSLELTATEETVLSLAVREAVTNIVRHARATTCLVYLGLTPDGFHTLQVEDDGEGRSDLPREGNGLRGMRERVHGLGGRFHFGSGGRSLPGTTLRIELPAATSLRRVEP